MIKKIILNKLILLAFINIFVYYIFCLKALTYAFNALVFFIIFGKNFLNKLKKKTSMNINKLNSFLNNYNFF